MRITQQNPTKPNSMIKFGDSIAQPMRCRYEKVWLERKWKRIHVIDVTAISLFRYPPLCHLSTMYFPTEFMALFVQVFDFAFLLLHFFCWFFLRLWMKKFTLADAKKYIFHYVKISFCVLWLLFFYEPFFFLYNFHSNIWHSHATQSLIYWLILNLLRVLA